MSPYKIIIVDKAPPAATTTSLWVSETTIVVGQSLMLTATVTGSGKSPTGTVTFFDGGIPIGTATLSGGTATLVTMSLARGDHPLTAGYPATADFQASKSATRSVAVTGVSSLVTVTCSASTATVGQTLWLAVTVTSTAGTPTGPVSFLDGGSAIGQAALVNGSAVINTSSLGIGAHSLSGYYWGDSTFNATASNVQVVVVNPAPVSITKVAMTQRRGITTSIVLQANGPLDPRSASNLGYYTLAYAGRDRKFGTRDDQKIRLASVSYNSAAHTVTLKPRGQLKLTGIARLLVDHVLDAWGRPFDGNSDGQPGGAFTALLNKR
jgi:hypothetical protein